MRILIALALLASCALGQVAETAVTDTVRVPVSAGLFSGSVDIRPSHSMTCGSSAYAPVPVQVNVTNGALSLTLVPNSECTPVDGEGAPASYYTARFVDRSRGMTWTETWVVPVSAVSVPLSAIRAAVPMAASTTIAQSQVSGLTAALAAKADDPHASTHAAAGSDPVTISQSQVASLELDLSGKAAASHEHNASAITAGTLVAERGGLGADASAFSGFVRMSGGTATAAAIANSDLPAAFDVSGKTSTKPAKAGTEAPATCTVGEAFFDTDATPGANWLLCTATNTWTAVVGTGGEGGGTTVYSVASFATTFTSQTSVTLAHNFGTLKQVIGCANGSGVWIEPNTTTLGTNSSTVTFGAAQTGSCTVIGGTGLYEESFTSQTSVNLDHDYNTTSIVVKCYDGSNNEVEPNTITATDANNATVTFSVAQTGRCVVASTLADGGGGGAGTVTSVGLSAPAEFTVTNSPVTTSGTLTAAWATQPANRVFAGPTTGSAATPTFRALVGADLPAMVGDSGSGGTKGAVPAPAAGDAAAGKYLKADGTWAVPEGSGGGGSGDTTNLSATATLSSWGTISANSCIEKNITLSGATSGDAIAPGWPSTLEAGVMGMMLPGTDVVVVRLCNVTGSGVAVADGKTFKAMVLRSTL